MVPRILSLYAVVSLLDVEGSMALAQLHTQRSKEYRKAADKSGSIPSVQSHPKDKDLDIPLGVAAAGGNKPYSNPEAFSERMGRTSEKGDISKRIDKQERESRSKHKAHGTDRGRKYQRRYNVFRRRACKTKSGFVVLKKAKDLNGDTVKIAPLFEIDGVRIEQVFHESYCDVENCRCKGVDSDMYVATCETNYMLTYARVMKRRKIGWTHIKIRTGCSCNIREKWRPVVGNIIEFI